MRGSLIRNEGISARKRRNERVSGFIHIVLTHINNINERLIHFVFIHFSLDSGLEDWCISRAVQTRLSMLEHIHANSFSLGCSLGQGLPMTCRVLLITSFFAACLQHIPVLVLHAK